MAYDAAGRRVSKAINGTGIMDATTHYYLSGNSVIEERNGSDRLLEQYVHGLTYSDELVQVGINSDPPYQTACDYFFSACQDANFNVLGLISPDFGLVERYQYSAYSQRQVLVAWGGNDPGAYTPMNSSPCWNYLGTTPLNEFGHQGLMHDEEIGVVYNRARMLHPTLGRFMQQDPFGYVDGMNVLAYEQDSPVYSLDSNGMDDMWNPIHTSGLINMDGSTPSLPSNNLPQTPTVQQIIDSRWNDAIRTSHLPRKATGINGISAICEGSNLVGLTIDLTTHQRFSGIITLPDGTDVIVQPNTSLGIVVGKGFIAIGTSSVLEIIPSGIRSLVHVRVSAILFNENGNLLRNDASGVGYPAQATLDATLINANLGEIAKEAAGVVDQANTACNPCNDFKFWKAMGGELRAINTQIANLHNLLNPDSK